MTDEADTHCAIPWREDAQYDPRGYVVRSSSLIWPRKGVSP